MIKPSITIILPVYNVEEYIIECITSIVNQTYDGPISCIVVDDCSKDGSMELLKSFLSNYHGDISIQIIENEHNKGLSFSRNVGISNASSDYIMFVDSDDYLYKNSINTLVMVANKYNMPEVVCGAIITDCPSNRFYNKTFPDFYLCNNNFIKNALWTGKLEGVAWNKLLKTDFVKKNNLFFKEGVIFEDNLWSFQLYHLASSLVSSSSKTYFYRVRPNSISTSLKIDKSLDSMVAIVDEIYKDSAHKRYELEEEDKLFIRELQNTILLQNIINSQYKGSFSRKDRLKYYNEVPEKYKLLFKERYDPSTKYLFLIKKLFCLRMYRTLDFMISLRNKL